MRYEYYMNVNNTGYKLVSLQELKNESYNVKAYVVSVQPVRPGQGENPAKTVVENTDPNACAKNYRSNVKYYTFNKVTRALLNDYPDLKYVETFTKIVSINEQGRNYPYKIDYNTKDSIHWDENTTKKYMTIMLESNQDL